MTLPMPPQNPTPTRLPAVRKSRRPARSASGFYLPAWSLLLMIGVVFVTAFAIVAIVFVLGGTPAPPSEPVIVIITAQPATAAPDAATQASPATPTPTSPLVPGQAAPGALPVFVLEGPTLAPVVLSPTPLSVAVGGTVEVDSDDPVNVRAAAGVDQRLLFTVARGERFTVLDGPQQATGFSWWRIQDPADPARGGWIAANFIRAVAP